MDTTARVLIMFLDFIQGLLADMTFFVLLFSQYTPLSVFCSFQIYSQNVVRYAKL